MSASLFAAVLAAAAPGGVTPAELAMACQDRDGWQDAAPPAELAPGTYYVGTCGLAAILVTGPAGHVLIDGGSAAAAPLIAANIARLGFRLRDVRLLLNTHEHADHAGGLADLKRRTGAMLAVRAPARGAMETGRIAPDDPQAGFGTRFPAVRVDRIVRDGEVVRVGPLRLTARATPGHAAGSTSWTWRTCGGGACRSVAYVDSLTALGAEGYRFSDHPAWVTAFRASLNRVAALPCHLLITPHPGASRLWQRLSGAGSRAAPATCRDYAADAARRLDDQLRKETR